MIRLKREYKNDKSYKIGRWLFILLAIGSIPIDVQQMQDEIQKSKLYIDKSLYDTVQFYSATMSLHLIGLVSALEHEIWLTVSSRLLVSLIYQFDINSGKNATIPQDPQQIEKLMRRKYEHKYRQKANQKSSSKIRSSKKQ